MVLEYQHVIKSDKDIYNIYQSLGWLDYLNLNENQLALSMKQSFLVVYVYDEENLIATGRVVSDGIINAYICGICVLEPYRKKGIGSNIVKLLVEACKKNNLHIQLVCEEHLIEYYQTLGFKKFASAMKYMD